MSYRKNKNVPGYPPKPGQLNFLGNFCEANA